MTEMPHVPRRTFLGLAAGVTAGAAAAAALPASAAEVSPAAARPYTEWPSAKVWSELRSQVGRRLIRPEQPWARLKPGASVPPKFTNPWYLEEQAGATQSTGMYRAWTSRPSGYAVAAESARDIQAAVNFARKHRVRVVVKGTGHDYYGRSCGPRQSLLIWTHNMRQITVHESFVPQGAPAGTPGVTALTTTAGNRWLEAYKIASANGLYVQGGGCTSVGACGGFALGGGFGSFSKRFGSGAAGVLELTVVLANGKIVTANAYQNADLYWALKGGGGGTFGVVTHMTYLAHTEPTISGWIGGPITAKSDAAYLELLQRYVEFAGSTLSDPAWGEGVILNEGYAMAEKFDTGLNVMQVGTTFLDMSTEEAEAAWEPFLAPLRARPEDFTVDVKFSSQPFRNRWNPTTREAIFDNRRNAPAGYFWWTGNAAEVGAYWGAYDGRGVPWSMTQGSNARTLAQGLFDASRTSLILWQTNKALYGEHPEAKARDEETSINPAVFDNVAFITVGAWKQSKYPGVDGHEPDAAVSQAQYDGVMTASAFIHKATPGGGSYSNEGNYFQKGWQTEFWGANYDRLLAIKKKYDPTNLFHVHKGVGSEGY
ncbi:MAG: FAD-binding protein [Candidatus Nanopelagicales bacterium]|jgi:FAD/FMN-containing dehydrogenase